MLEFKVHDGDNEVVLQFEHSLLALSKWEANSKKAFLTLQGKTPAELLDYFRCMIAPGQDPDLVYRMSPDQLDKLEKYISDTQTATTFMKEATGKRSGDIATSEVIYGWLVGLKIPFHPVETWHLNRVMVLVRVVQANNEPPKKPTREEALNDWQRVNEANRKFFGSEG